MLKLEGKVALVTGGNSGIGLASAKLFAAEGARVVITGRRKDVVEIAARQIGAGALGIPGDVSELADLDRLYAEIQRRFDRLDVVFANAGILAVAPFESVTPAQFDREMAVNLRGMYFTVQKALPLMREGGSIILNSSSAHATGNAGYSLYGAAKAAARSLARNLTVELSGRRIRVNSISPGPTVTPIVEKMGLPRAAIESGFPELLAQIPLGRMADADEIAAAVLFLASDASSFVTGIDLGVDGGLAQI